MARTLQTRIDIDASPEVVHTVLTDLDGYATWNPFITSSSGRVAVGERLVNRMELPGKRAATFMPKVTELESGRVFEWLGRLGLPGLFDGRHRFELEPLPSGGTRLHHGETFTGILVPLIIRSIHDATVEGFEMMNAALKARAEAQVGAGK